MPPTLAAVAADVEHHAEILSEVQRKQGQQGERIAVIDDRLPDVLSQLEQIRGEIAVIRQEMPKGWVLAIPPGSGRVVGLVIGGIMAGLLTGGVGGAGRDIALEVVREVVGIEAPRQPVAVPVPVPMPVPMPPANP